MESVAQDHGGEGRRGSRSNDPGSGSLGVGLDLLHEQVRRVMARGADRSLSERLIQVAQALDDRGVGRVQPGIAITQVVSCQGQFVP